MAVLEGEKMGMYVGGTLIAAALSTDLKRAMATRSINNKDSGHSESKAPGRTSGSVSGRSHFDFDAAYGYSDLHSIMDNRTKITCKVSTEEAGDDEYTFDGYLTQLDATFPDHENSEYDWTVEITGDITESVVSA